MKILKSRYIISILLLICVLFSLTQTILLAYADTDIVRVIQLRSGSSLPIEEPLSEPSLASFQSASWTGNELLIGSQIHYNISVTNNSEIRSESIEVVVDLSEILQSADIIYDSFVCESDVDISIDGKKMIFSFIDFLQPDSSLEIGYILEIKTLDYGSLDSYVSVNGVPINTVSIPLGYYDLTVSKELSTHEDNYYQGDRIGYDIVIENTGTRPITNITFLANKYPNWEIWPFTLNPGEKREFPNRIYRVSERDSQENISISTFSVSSTELPDVSVTRSVTISKPNYSLAMFSEIISEAPYKPGDTITCSVNLLNNGEHTIKSLSIYAVANREKIEISKIFSLSPGSSRDIEYTYRIPVGLKSGSICSVTFGVESEFISIPENSIPIEISANPNMNVSVQLKSDKSQVIEGNTVSFDLFVSNTGDIPLSNVGINLTSIGNWKERIDYLAVGSSKIYPVSVEIDSSLIKDKEIVLSVDYGSSEVSTMTSSFNFSLYSPNVSIKNQIASNSVDNIIDVINSTDSSSKSLVRSASSTSSIPKTDMSLGEIVISEIGDCIVEEEKYMLNISPIDGYFHHLTKEETANYLISVTNTSDKVMHNLRLTSSIDSSWSYDILEIGVGQTVQCIFSYNVSNIDVMFHSSIEFIITLRDSDKEPLESRLYSFSIFNSTPSGLNIHSTNGLQVPRTGHILADYFSFSWYIYSVMFLLSSVLLMIYLIKMHKKLPKS